MPPAILAVVMSLVEEAIKLEPSIVAEMQTIFSKPSPTPDDWAALRAKVLAKQYGDYVPSTVLVPGV